MTIQRNGAVDWLKGLAIFLVVMGHELQWSTFHLDASQLLSNGNWCLVQQWISSFHMPLFFFVSGYLIGYKEIVHPHTPSFASLLSGILRRTQTLLLPAFSWMFVKHFIKGGWQMEWFLITLYIIFIVFSIIRYFALRHHFHIIIESLCHLMFFVGIMFLAHHLKGTWVYEHLFLRSIANYYPYVVMGFFFSAYKWDKYWMTHNILYTCALLVFAGSFGLYYWVLYDSCWAVYIFPYVIATSAILTIFSLANWFNSTFTHSTVIPAKCSNIVNAIFQYMGRKSLAIYVIHFYFLLGIPQAADLWTHLTENAVTSIPAIGVQLIYGISSASIVVAICLGLESIISRSNLLNFLCFGKDFPK